MIFTGWLGSWTNGCDSEKNGCLILIIKFEYFFLWLEVDKYQRSENQMEQLYFVIFAVHQY